ncbi:FimD/PapC C-terminal domain-containing protein, partial [Shewanella sp.]|uniref:FimD/PapC C-terminal domain-containing protein n=1 Tax=Shewanella sp. TaxID=50422 RepID=UPI00356B5A24
MAAENHGVDVDFELYQTKAAIVIVNDEQGQPIPVGALATLNGEQNGEFVGWDGELYLEKLLDNNTLTLVWDGKQCVLEFAYSKQEDDIPVIGPLVCATEDANALVMINDQQGQPVPAGTLAIINDQLEPKVVGKNGQLSLSSLRTQNIITLNWADQQCSAEFSYRKTDEQTPVIGPIICEPKQFIATVIVNDSKGNPIPAGASAIINSDKQPQTVAHHGEVYPQALQAQNQMVLQWDNKQCSVEFSYTQINHQKAIIGPLVCEQSDSMVNVTSPEAIHTPKSEVVKVINTVAIDVEPTHVIEKTHSDEQTQTLVNPEAAVNTQASMIEQHQGSIDLEFITVTVQQVASQLVLSAQIHETASTTKEPVKQTYTANTPRLILSSNADSQFNPINNALLTQNKVSDVYLLTNDIASKAGMPNAPNWDKARWLDYTNIDLVPHHDSTQQAPPQPYLFFKQRANNITQQSKGETV